MAKTYGITTIRAHLDPIVPTAPSGEEIAYVELVNWLRTADASQGLPFFAGRYFLGWATQAEIEDGFGFCLWAHGECADPSLPKKIVPLQRGDPQRLSATGAAGQAFGRDDATALAGYLDRCLAVGDLEIGSATQILVFLDVPNGTPLSIDYWASWATTVYDAFLVPARLAERTGVEGVQPLLPAIQCAFTMNDDTDNYMPEPAVRACLDLSAPHGTRAVCYGFWARRWIVDESDPPEKTFDWINLGDYRQPRQILGLYTPLLQRVPIRYLRWFNGPEGLPIPEGPLRDTLALLTLDWPATDADDPLGSTLTATDWRADASAGVEGPLTTLPAQLGVDTASNLLQRGNPPPPPKYRCLRDHTLTITRMPYQNQKLVDKFPDRAAPVTVVNETKRCAFAFRYYSQLTVPKNLRHDEAVAISQAGIQAAVVWEESFKVVGVPWDPYVTRLIEPYVLHHGHDDAVAAFSHAANVIRQPPFTPIYFAVDFPIDIVYWNGDPTQKGVQTPDLPTVIQYFRDVNRGYHTYLATHPTCPYHIGAYTQVEVFVALYRGGLASHFWQVPWATWGNSRRPFPHLNVWQVGPFNLEDVQNDNSALMNCVEVDINVAWGDPGGFQVFP